MSNWYIARNGVQRGPVPDQDLQGLITRGELRQTDMVWTEGEPEWQPASNLEGVDWSAAPPPPPPSLPAATHPTVTTVYPQQSGKAVASLVCSLLGYLFCPLLFHILGLALGYSARGDIAASKGSLTGEGLATAGIVLGWIGLGLIFAGLLFYVLFFVFILGAAAMV